MYDYRQDIIDLMNKTENSNKSLKQSAQALLTISQILLNDSVSPLIKPVKTQIKRPEKLLTSHEDNHTQDTQIALQAKSEPKSEPKKDKPMSQKKDPLSIALTNLKEDQYLVMDKLSGCDIKDKNNNSIAYFNEKIQRDLGLLNGDIVTLNYNASQDRYFLDSIVGHADLTKTIDYFKYAKVDRDALGYCITENINHKQLSNSNSKRSRYGITASDITKFNLKIGDFIDLAWYNSQPENISIIWKYDLNKPADSVAPKKHSEYSENGPTKKVNSKLDFDLNNKTVALVTADDSVTGKFSDLVKLHNGQPLIVESINGANVTGQLKSADLIILLQIYLSHDTTKTIIAKYKDDKQIALSETAGQLNLEKAMYRALNNLNITDSDNIEYPVQ